MKLVYYQKADCTLFRLPPLDLSVADSKIELAFVNAWQQGRSIDNALNSVLSDQTLVGALVSQLEENLRFQQESLPDTARTGYGIVRICCRWLLERCRQPERVPGRPHGRTSRSREGRDSR